ncbi:MAG: CPBP family intramembrane metalloprotease [Tepidisphaeraceae bacterium]
MAGFGLVVYGGGMNAVGMTWRRLPTGALAGAIGIFVALPIVFFALQGTLYLWSALHFEHPAKHELLEAIDADPRRWVKIAAVVSAAVVAPFFEELLFRGCVQNGLRRATGNPWLAIAVASILFASIHAKWTIPPIFVFSVLLGIVYERTRNLWATTIMHALFNAFSLMNSGMN